MPAALPSFPQTCPRCRGRLFAGGDAYGAYSSCFACGYVHEAVSGPSIDLPSDSGDGVRQRRREPTHGRQRL